MATNSMLNTPMAGGPEAAGPMDPSGAYTCVAICSDPATGKFMVASIPQPDEATLASAQSFDTADQAMQAAQDLLTSNSPDPMAGTSPDDAMADGYAGARGDPAAISSNARKYGGM